MLIPITELVKKTKEVISTVSATEAAELYQQSNCLLIDVREASEAEASAIQHAISIPRGILEAKIIATCNDENMPILVHCQTGGRACLAVEQLLKMGYKNVKAITATHQEICQHFNQ